MINEGHWCIVRMLPFGGALWPGWSLNTLWLLKPGYIYVCCEKTRCCGRVVLSGFYVMGVGDEVTDFGWVGVIESRV